MTRRISRKSAVIELILTDLATLYHPPTSPTSSPWTRPFFTSCCAAVRPVSLASLFTPDVSIVSSSINFSELASLKRPLTNQLVFFTRLESLAWFPPGFQTDQFLQKL